MSGDTFSAAAVSSTLSPAKEPQLDDVRAAWIHGREGGQRLVNRDEIRTRLGGHRQAFVERDLPSVAASFLIALRARDVDQDAAHQARRQGKEVPAVPQVDVTQIRQAQ